MDALFDNLPSLIAMAVLVASSGFFSASEAALFSLRWKERLAMANGTRTQQMAAGLLKEPDRLLTAVLFWNLVINVAYFTIATIVGLALEKHELGGSSSSVVFAAASLLTLIFLSEMLPKSVAVLSPMRLSGLFALPLALAVRIVSPLIPLLQTSNLLSRRLLWPSFEPEPYLDVSDLERAIEISTSDANLIEQEQAVLRNIVLLSDIRVEEWMRPRTQFISFRPPVSLSDLGGKMTPSRYLLVTEPDTEEIASALNLEQLADVPQEHLEHHATPVVYVPWCAPVADALERIQAKDRQVAVVVNEFGETIGILTIDDLIDTVFTYSPSRSKIILDRKPIHDIGPGKWLVAGVTSLRRLSRFIGIQLPESKSVTLAGVVQESLGRLAVAGDECEWGPFHLRVLEVPQRGLMLIEVILARRESESA